MTTQSFAIHILRLKGPMLTGELAKLIAERNKCSLNAATTAVSRLRSPVSKLRGVVFPDNQKLIYLIDQFASLKFQDSLKEKMISSNIAAGRALQGVYARGGVIRSGEFSIVSGAPAKDLKKQLRDHVVLKQLTENKLLKTHELGFLYEASLMPDFKTLISLFALNDLLIEKCTDWCLRVGFTSNGIAANKLTSKELPQFGLFNWDIVSPTYLHGLRTYNGKKKKMEAGFFAADAIISAKVLGISDLVAFKNKIEIIKAQKKIKPFIPAIIHLGMSDEALKVMRSVGVMCLEPKSFGDPHLGELIKELLLFLSKNEIFFKDQPRFEQLIKLALSKEYGRLLNLAGPLFQMTLALLNKQQGHAVDLDKKIYSSKGGAEIDLWIITHRNELISAEVKGFKKGKRIDISEVIEWIRIKRPRIVEWANHNYKDSRYKPVRFQFIISSEFSPDDLKTITEIANAEFKQHPVEFLDIRDVKRIIDVCRQPEILKCIEEHYGDRI